MPKVARETLAVTRVQEHEKALIAFWRQDSGFPASVPTYTRKTACNPSSNRSISAGVLYAWMEIRISGVPSQS